MENSRAMLLQNLQKKRIRKPKPKKTPTPAKAQVTKTQVTTSNESNSTSLENEETLVNEPKKTKRVGRPPKRKSAKGPSKPRGRRTRNRVYSVVGRKAAEFNPAIEHETLILQLPLNTSSVEKVLNLSTAEEALLKYDPVITTPKPYIDNSGEFGTFEQISNSTSPTSSNVKELTYLLEEREFQGSDIKQLVEKHDIENLKELVKKTEVGSIQELENQRKHQDTQFKKISKKAEFPKVIDKPIKPSENISLKYDPETIEYSSNTESYISPFNEDENDNILELENSTFTNPIETEVPYKLDSDTPSESFNTKSKKVKTTKEPPKNPPRPDKNPPRPDKKPLKKPPQPVAVTTLHYQTKSAESTTQFTEKVKVTPLLPDLFTLKPGEWPEKIDIRCWWCCNYFTGPPVSMPLKYDPLKDLFTVFGVTCSFNCAKSYITLEKKGKQELLSFMYRKLTGNNLRFIQPALPKQVLNEFGGPLSIDEYRKTFTSLTNYTITQMPLIPIIQQLVETNRTAVTPTVDSTATSLSDLPTTPVKPQKKLRLKRSKPLPNARFTLDNLLTMRKT